MVTPAEILLVISVGSAVFLRYVSNAILNPNRTWSMMKNINNSHRFSIYAYPVKMPMSKI